jgi:hypothetical protein
MEPLTSVPGWTETDYREGDEATENQTDLLNYKWRQPSGRVARKASLVHNPGIKVGRVISQETAAEQLLLLPNSEQQNLCLFQLLLFDPVEAIPEFLRCKTLRSKAPYGAEDRAVIPSGYFSLGAWLANPMDGGQ